MRLITWNCHGNFNKKYPIIKALNPDVCIITRTENPYNSSDDNYLDFTQNHIHIGDKKEGLLVFADKNMKLVENNWVNGKTKYFTSINMDNKFSLVCINPVKPYTQNIQQYLTLNKTNFKNTDKIILTGNFNIDPENIRERIILNKLKSMGLNSIYHEKYNEKIGSESIPTYYEYCHNDNTSHIDYVYRKGLEIQDIEIGTFNDYVVNPKKYSDHVPVIVDIQV